MVQQAKKNRERMQLPPEGFTVIPFIPKHEMNDLILFYKNNPHFVKERGFHSTMHQPDYEYRKSVLEKISASVSQSVHELFPDHRILVANFVVKEPSIDSDVGLHSDWNYVDEAHHRSINIWCPLVDTNPLNGRLMVCPATQFLSNDFRGTPFVPYNKQEEARFKKKSVGLNMKKGDAAIYDSALLHFSEPNITSLSRLAIAIVLIPKDAQPIHCFTHNGKTFVYDVNHEFFLTHQLGEIPCGYIVSREVPHHPPTEVSDAGSSSDKPSF